MNTNETIEAVRGDELNIIFEVTGMDLTGKSARSHFKNNIDDSADLIFIDGDGSIVIDVQSITLTVLTFKKTATQMANLEIANYKYDIEVYSTVDDVVTICNGTLKIIKDVTT